MILSSTDDPFLGEACFPSSESLQNALIETHYTRFGGHVGYITNLKMLETYAEKMAVSFLSKQ